MCVKIFYRGGAAERLKCDVYGVEAHLAKMP